MKYISSSYLDPLVPVGHEEITKTAFSSVGQALVGVARAVDLAWTLFLRGGLLIKISSDYFGDKSTGWSG